MEKYCIQHKILNAQALYFLQEIPCGFLPCSEVDLSNVSSYDPGEKKRGVFNMHQKLNRVTETNMSFILVEKLQLVFDCAMNNADKIDIPAEKKHQEPLPLKR